MGPRQYLSENLLLLSSILLSISICLFGIFFFSVNRQSREGIFSSELNRKASIAANSFIAGLGTAPDYSLMQSAINQMATKTPEIEELSFLVLEENKFKVVASSKNDLMGTIEANELAAKAWSELKTYSVLERRMSGRGIFKGVLISSDPSSSINRLFDGFFPLIENRTKVPLGLIHLRFSFFDSDSIYSSVSDWEKLNIFLLAAITLPLIIYFGFLANKATLKVNLLKETSKAKDDLLSFAAHELNSPLANIKGSLSVILEDKSYALPPNLEKIGRRAMISVEQLVALVEDLLTVSRFERGKIEIFPRPVHLEDTLEESYNQFKVSAEDHNLQLIYEKPLNPLPKVIVDPDKMREVFNNLISNGIKYTEKGSVTVRTEIRKRDLVIVITDTGTGVSPDDLPKLFTRFGRLKRTISVKGTGLGLYITRLIIEAHKGKISADSQLGKGTIFYVSLPIPKMEENPSNKDESGK